MVQHGKIEKKSIPYCHLCTLKILHTEHYTYHKDTYKYDNPQHAHYDRCLKVKDKGNKQNKEGNLQRTVSTAG